MKNLLLSLFVILSASLSTLNAENISAYLVGEHMDAKTARKALKSIGYEIVVTYDSVVDGKTIVFTNEALKNEASKPNRAHAAVLRLFVDNQAKNISITNPVYFGKAFMQDDYNENVFNGELEKLSGAFPGLTGSKDKLDADDISGFHFTFGMPYYEDADVLAKGTNADLLAKVNASGNAIFTLELANSTLVGYALENNDFVSTIGRANASVLPYCIAIEDGKATALGAKYYLAITYPLLTMGEFTTIMSVPGEILNALEKPFK